MSGWFPGMAAGAHQCPKIRLKSRDCQHVKQLYLKGCWEPIVLAVLVWDTLWKLNAPSTLKDCSSVTDPLGGRGDEESKDVQFVLAPGRVPQGGLGGSAGSKTCR